MLHPSPPQMETPTLPEIPMAPSLVSQLNCRASTSWAALLLTSSSERMLRMRTRNSSPPMRPMTSSFLKQSVMTRAKSQMTRSPT